MGRHGGDQGLTGTTAIGGAHTKEFCHCGIANDAASTRLARLITGLSAPTVLAAEFNSPREQDAPVIDA